MKASWSIQHYTRDNSVYTSMKSLSWYISSYTSMAELSWVILSSSYTCVRIPDVGPGLGTSCQWQQYSENKRFVSDHDHDVWWPSRVSRATAAQSRPRKTINPGPPSESRWLPTWIRRGLGPGPFCLPALANLKGPSRIWEWDLSFWNIQVHVTVNFIHPTARGPGPSRLTRKVWSEGRSYNCMVPEICDHLISSPSYLVFLSYSL